MRLWCADSGVKGCERCGEADIIPNVEAYEITGKCICDECANQIFEKEEERQ